MRILIAEDDEDIAELLRIYLVNEGFEVVHAGDGRKAWDLFSAQSFQMCILDIMMPGLSGFEVAAKIREAGNVPILFLSAKSEDADKILGLNIGADDYMTKPFNPLELVARVKTHLRRAYHMNEPANVLTGGELTVNIEAFTCMKNEQQILLTPTEFRILVFLMKSPRQIFTKNQIYENVIGSYFESDDNTMMVHISKLRDKIEDDPKHPRYIHTIRGVGYKFEDRPE